MSNRNLYIDQHGRLRPKHNGHRTRNFEFSQWGNTCRCCGLRCTPKLLKEARGAGVWRFEVKRALRNRLDARHGKFRWLRLRFPRLMRELEAEETWIRLNGCMPRENMARYRGGGCVWSSGTVDWGSSAACGVIKSQEAAFPQGFAG